MIAEARKQFVQDEGDFKISTAEDINETITVRRMMVAHLDKPRRCHRRSGADDLPLRNADREAHDAYYDLSVMGKIGSGPPLDNLGQCDILQKLSDSLSLNDLKELATIVTATDGKTARYGQLWSTTERKTRAPQPREVWSRRRKSWFHSFFRWTLTLNALKSPASTTKTTTEGGRRNKSMRSEVILMSIAQIQ